MPCVGVGGLMEHKHLTRLHHGYTPPRLCAHALGRQPNQVTHLEVLQLRDYLSGAVDVEVRQVLQPVVGAQAPASHPELHEPLPYLPWRGVNG